MGDELIYRLKTVEDAIASAASDLCIPEYELNALQRLKILEEKVDEIIYILKNL